MSQLNFFLVCMPLSKSADTCRNHVTKLNTGSFITCSVSNLVRHQQHPLQIPTTMGQCQGEVFGVLGGDENTLIKNYVLNNCMRLLTSLYGQKEYDFYLKVHDIPLYTRILIITIKFSKQVVYYKFTVAAVSFLGA